jgi:hypothetical protein
MTLPLKNAPGSLGELGFASGATAEFQDYKPREGASITSVFTNADQAGTVQIFRVGRDGAEKPLSAPVVLVAGTEDSQQINFPIDQIRVKYVNTNATAGKATCEVTDSGS